MNRKQLISLRWACEPKKVFRSLIFIPSARGHKFKCTKIDSKNNFLFNMYGEVTENIFQQPFRALPSSSTELTRLTFSFVMHNVFIEKKRVSTFSLSVTLARARFLYEHKGKALRGVESLGVVWGETHRPKKILVWKIIFDECAQNNTHHAYQATFSISLIIEYLGWLHDFMSMTDILEKAGMEIFEQKLQKFFRTWLQVRIKKACKFSNVLACKY